MNFLSRFIFHASFIIIFSLLLLLAPFFFIKAHNLKSILNSINFYSRISPIISSNLSSTISIENNEIVNLIKTQPEKILDQNSLAQLTENIIDEVFLVIHTDQSLDDIQINVSSFQDNLLNLLNQSESSASSEIISSLPNTFFLSDLFNFTPNVIDHYSFLIKNYSLFFKILFIACILLLCFLIYFYFIFFPKTKITTIILNNLLIIGLIFFTAYFIYQFIFISPSIIQTILDKLSSTFYQLLFIVSLSFLNHLSRIYSLIGIVLISLSVLVKILLYYKYHHDDQNLSGN